MEIKVVDLKGQYENMKDEISCGIQQVLDSTVFIKTSDDGEIRKALIEEGLSPNGLQL